MDGVGTALAGIRLDADGGIEALQTGGGDFEFALAGDFRPFQAVDRDLVAVRALLGVHDLQQVDVLDAPVVGFAGKHRAVADDVELERDAVRQEPGAETADDDQDGGVQHDPRTDDVGRDLLAAEMLRQCVFGRVADQAARQANLVHDLVADVDTGGAADAFVLQAVADVDPGRADMHALAAVDAVAETGGLGIDAFLAGAALFAAFRVIGDDQRVRVEHHALEAGVGAHVLAHLFAQEAGHQDHEAAVEEDPEGFPGAEAVGQHVVDQFLDRGEVADQGEAAPQAEHGPQQVLGAAQRELAAAQRCLVELHAGVAVAFDQVLDPHVHLGVHRLRAGVAAEQAPGDGGDQEQRVSRDDQQRSEVDHVLRPEDHAEDVELAFDQVEEDGLAPVPFEPQAAVEEDLGEQHQRNAPVVEKAAHALGVDFLAFLVKRDLGRSRFLRFVCWIHRGVDRRKKSGYIKMHACFV